MGFIGPWVQWEHFLADLKEKMCIALPQMIYEKIWSRGGMILTGKNLGTEKTCPSATLSITNPTWTAPGANQGFRSIRYIVISAEEVPALGRGFEVLTMCWKPPIQPGNERAVTSSGHSHTTRIIVANNRWRHDYYSTSTKQLEGLGFHVLELSGFFSLINPATRSMRY